MAKSKSVFKFQGTFAGLTFVSSSTYGDHIRAKRGTHKKAKLNAAMKKANVRLKEANVPAKIFKDAIEPYRGHLIDGTLWQRTLSLFRKQQKEKGSIDFSTLAGLEIDSRHPLKRFLQVTPTVKKQSGKSILDVELQYQTPTFKKSKSVDGYKLTLISVFPDLKKKSARTIAITSDVIQLKDAITGFHASVDIPGRAKTCVLCVKAEGCEQGEPVNTISTQGMRVVAVVQLSSADQITISIDRSHERFSHLFE